MMVSRGGTMQSMKMDMFRICGVLQYIETIGYGDRLKNITLRAAPPTVSPPPSVVSGVLLMLPVAAFRLSSSVSPPPPRPPTGIVSMFAGGAEGIRLPPGEFP